MSNEATAAIVGAAVGGGLAFLAQLGVLMFVAWRERRAAARIIYAELAVGLGEASAAIQMGEWGNLDAAPHRSAWEGFGVKLVGKPGVERVAHVASAYSRLEDFAWLARSGHLSSSDDYAEWLRDIQVGLYEVGRLAGMGDAQLRRRMVLDTVVEQQVKESRKLSRRDRFRR